MDSSFGTETEALGNSGFGRVLRPDLDLSVGEVGVLSSARPLVLAEAASAGADEGAFGGGIPPPG